MKLSRPLDKPLLSGSSQWGPSGMLSVMLRFTKECKMNGNVQVRPPAAARKRMSERAKKHSFAHDEMITGQSDER